MLPVHHPAVGSQQTCRIRKHFGYGQHAARIRPDCICLFRLPASNFPKKGQIILCKTGPDPIWMALSGLGQMQLVWKQASVQESSNLVSGRTQPARYQFPTFRLSYILPQMARIIFCKTSPDLISFWLTVLGLGQTDLVQKQINVQESSSPLLADASEPIPIICESGPACLLGCYCGRRN